MRASTSQKNLNIKGDLRALLMNRKKEQEYALNKNYKQFESTYNKDFKEQSPNVKKSYQQSPSQQIIENLKVAYTQMNKQNNNSNQNAAQMQRSLMQTQSLINLKNERANLLQEYLQAKKRSNHRNIQTFQTNRDQAKQMKITKQLNSFGGNSKSIIDQKSEKNNEKDKEVIEEYFNKTSQAPFYKRSESQFNLQSQNKGQQSLDSQHQQQRQMANSMNRSQSQGTLLKQTFPRKHKYLIDHIEHLQQCPQLVCVCCSTKTGDHFLPFRYPQNIGTQYEKNFTKEVNEKGKKSQLFNLDSEKTFGTKVQSGQQYVTTMRNDFKQFQVKPNFGGVKKYNDHVLYDEEGNRKEHLDFHQNSTYRTNFRGLHVDGVYHERNPVYPIYSMPLKDSSSYQRTYNTTLQSPIKKEEAEFDKTLVDNMIKRAKEGRVLYQDMPFQSTTTNRKNFSSSKPYDKATLCPPPNDPVTTFTMPDHFLSLKQQDYQGSVKPKCEINELKHKIMNGTVKCKHTFKQHL